MEDGEPVAFVADEVDDEPEEEIAIPEYSGLGFCQPGASLGKRRRGRVTRTMLGARARTISPKQMTVRDMRMARMMYPPVEDDRPKTRGECREELRPCPYVGCKFHLYLDVNPETGSIKINFPDLEPWELTTTCALDLAERGGITLEEVGEAMNLTRERVRQVEVKGLLKLKMNSPSEDELGANLLKPAPVLVQIRRRK